MNITITSSLAKGVQELEKKLKIMKDLHNGPKNVTVGYSAPYAIYVHENLEIDHPAHDGYNCGGQAKFLEIPMKEMRGDLQKYIAERLRKGAKIGPTLLSAGLKVQRASQKIVPVHTGRLRRSAFTELTDV